MTTIFSVEGVTSLADYLSFPLGTPVLDATALKGSHYYTVISQWAPGRGILPEVSDPSLPALPTALTEQLGLKLEPRKGPVDVLVIDSVQQPTQN